MRRPIPWDSLIVGYDATEGTLETDSSSIGGRGRNNR